MRVNEYGRVVNNFRDSISGHFRDVTIDEFVIMPNHVHGIVFIEYDVGAIHELPLQNESAIEQRKQRRKMLLPKIIGRFKMSSAKHINQIRNTPGVQVWQRNYYEHIIRNEGEMNRICEYITNNPTKWAEDENNPMNIKKEKSLWGSDTKLAWRGTDKRR